MSEVYSCYNCDSIDFSKLSCQQLKLNPKNYSKYSNDLLIYIGKKKITFQELSKNYNPFYRTDSDGIMKSSYKIDKIIKIDSSYYVIDDPQCIPTGVDSMPDGKYQFIDIVEDRLKLFQAKTIKNFKIQGQVITGNPNETIIYNNGFIAYYRNEFDSISFIEIKYDDCGKLKESISIQKKKTVGFESTDLGFGIIFNPESGNIESIYNLKNGLKTGLYHSFDNETGKFLKTVRYVNGFPSKIE